MSGGGRQSEVASKMATTQKNPIQYKRLAGVVCYELPVFRNLDAPQAREFALQLLASGLDWVWQSARAHPDEATRRHLPHRSPEQVLFSRWTQRPTSS